MHAKVKDLHRGIAEVNVAAPPNLFLVDAVETMVGAQECRHGGERCQLGKLFAGTDPVSLDCFGMELLQSVYPQLNLIKSKVKHINYAHKHGVGEKAYKIVEL